MTKVTRQAPVMALLLFCHSSRSCGKCSPNPRCLSTNRTSEARPRPKQAQVLHFSGSKGLSQACPLPQLFSAVNSVSCTQQLSEGMTSGGCSVDRGRVMGSGVYGKCGQDSVDDSKEDRQCREQAAV